jgi:hypothetical protein
MRGGTGVRQYSTRLVGQRDPQSAIQRRWAQVPPGWGRGTSSSQATAAQGLSSHATLPSAQQQVGSGAAKPKGWGAAAPREIVQQLEGEATDMLDGGAAARPSSSKEATAPFATPQVPGTATGVPPVIKPGPLCQPKLLPPQASQSAKPWQQQQEWKQKGPRAFGRGRGGARA